MFPIARVAKVDTNRTRMDALEHCNDNKEEHAHTKIAELFKHQVEMDHLLDNHIQLVTFQNNAAGVNKLKATMELEININGIAKGLGEYLRSHDSRYEARVMKDENDFTHFFKQYHESDLSSEEVQWAEELNVVFIESVRLTQEIIAINKLITSNRNEFVKSRRIMDQLLDEGIQEIAVDERNITSREANESISLTIRYASILLLFGVLINAAAAVFFSRELTRSIKKLSSSAKSISRGDLTTRVEISSNDEIGELADTFNVMAEELNNAKVELDNQQVNLETKIEKRTAEIRESKEILEKTVQERTAQLEKNKAAMEEKIAEFEKFYDATIDRELKMEKLRKRNKNLEARLKL